MLIKNLIAEIDRLLVAAFHKLDEWCDAPSPMRAYRPITEGWTINEILEHVALTNRYLLILIEKGATKALKNLNNLSLTTELANYSFERGKLNEIGLHKSFPWVRPEHMEPTGLRVLDDVRCDLHRQLIQCQEVLNKIPAGQGVLYRTTMTVNGLGEIDVYEFVYFLAKHAERHLTQIEKAAAEFRLQES